MNKHICLYCTSPCALTLAFTSEGCTNPKCQAYSAKPETDSENWKAAHKASQCQWGSNGGPCAECEKILAERKKAKRIDYAPPTVTKVDELVAGAILCTNGPQGQRCELCVKTLGGRRFNMNTETGRLSSKGPNYSNRPRPDYVPFFEHDNVKPLVNKDGVVVGLTGYDIHTVNAAKMYGVLPEQVTSEQRKNAKMTFYAKMYGSLSETLSFRALEEKAELALRQIELRGVTLDPTYLRKLKEGAEASLATHHLQPGKETKDCPGCEMENSQKKLADIYKEQAALWPNTMRVLAPGEIRKKDKTGIPLAGVLSLVDVQAKYGGRYATYDYVTFTNPQSVRCRIRAWRVGALEHWKAVQPRFQPHQGVSNSAFRVSIGFADREDEERLKTYHLSAILEEFTEHAALGRNPRRLTLGEKMTASAIRSGKRL